MKKVSEQDRHDNDAARARRKRIAEKVGRILLLAGSVFWLLIFIAISSTDYISWTGIVVGASIIGPCVLSSVAGVAGKRRLEKLLSRLSQIAVILAVVMAAALLLWPEDEGAWRPYTFENELAAIEAERAVPDQDNAALRYESALAAIDVNDRPELVFAGAFVRDELIRRPWRAADHPEVSQWLDSHAAVIGELSQIGELKKCRWPVYANSDCRWTVPYKKLHYGMQLLAMAGNRDLGEGKPQAALEECLCLLRNADHLYQQTDELDFRYAFQHERTSLEMLRHLLVGSESSSLDIEKIAHRLPTAADTWPQDTARLLEFDKFRFAQTMASVYEINEQGKIRFAASVRCLLDGAQDQDGSSLKGRAWRLYWFMNMPLNPEGVWDMGDRESAALAQFVQPGPMLRAPREPGDSLWSVLGFASKVLSNLARWYAHEMCLSEFTYANFGEYYAEEMTQRRGTWLVLGLRQYREAHGVWPQTLDMVAEYVPAEAFVDPTVGEGFVYALDGDSFRLYRKGSNRIDDGGRHRYVKALDKLEDDISMWPPPPPAEPPDEESIREELESIYGKEYLETLLKDHGSDKK